MNRFVSWKLTAPDPFLSCCQRLLWSTRQRCPSCPQPSRPASVRARPPSARDSRVPDEGATRFENAHRTVRREVLYRHHPWFGRRVCIHGTVDKDGYVVFRCTLDGSQTDRWLEVPAWMFDRTAYPDPGRLAAQPYVSIEALAALSALLDLALKDQTPSAALLSGASRASRDQNRGEIHVTRDDKLRERLPTQSTIAPAASDNLFGSGLSNDTTGAPAWPELPPEARAALTSLMTQLILDHAATTAMPRAKEVDHDL